MLAFAIGAVRTASAEGRPAPPPCPAYPWQRVGATGSAFVTPAPLLLTAGAGLLPLPLSPTGVDHDLRLVAQRDLGGRHDLEPVSVLAPYVAGGAVLAGYLVSVGARACDWQRPQAAILQATALTFGAVVLLKVSIGREWPNAGLDPTRRDRLDHPELARDFAPFERIGAWPSGHAAFFFAAASALRTSAPELGILSWIGYPLALGVAAGMWIGDHHWVSDILSGGLLGEAIGSSVGPGFSSSNARATLGFSLASAPGNGALGLAYGSF